jgi:hypothetical protein
MDLNRDRADGPLRRILDPGLSLAPRPGAGVQAIFRRTWREGVRAFVRHLLFGPDRDRLAQMLAPLA